MFHSNTSNNRLLEFQATLFIEFNVWRLWALFLEPDVRGFYLRFWVLEDSMQVDIGVCGTMGVAMFIGLGV